MCFSVAAISLILPTQTIATSSAAEQSIDEAPPLGLNTYVGHAIGNLHREARDLSDREATASQIRQASLRASINLRMFASKLLDQGDRAGPSGTIAVMHGLRLYHGRHHLDAVVQQLLVLHEQIDDEDDAASTQRFHAAHRAIRRFNDEVRDLPDRFAIEEDRVDRLVAAVMVPMTEAIEHLQPGPIGSHWIPIAVVDPAAAQVETHTPASTGAAGLRKLVSQLAERIEAVVQRESTKAALATTMDYLERGAAYPELRPVVSSCLPLLEETIDVIELAAPAEWLNEATRTLLSDQLDEAIAAFNTDETRAESEDDLRRLIVLAQLIDRGSVLVEQRQDMRALDAAVAALGESSASVARINQAITLLDRMIEQRRLQVPDLSTDFRQVYRLLESAYERAEQAILQRLSTMATNPHLLSDPAFGSLIGDHKQRLDDLRRLMQAPRWIAVIESVDSTSAARFESELRRWSRWLLDPNRRPEALDRIDRFEEQLDRFFPLPHEDALTRGEHAFIAATAAQNQQLVEAIVSTRREWAAAASLGETDNQAADRLFLLHRFMNALGDTVRLSHLLEEATLLDSWSAWDIGSEAIEQATAELPARVKLAAAAIVNGDDDTLRQQLDAIDREEPLASLVGRLASRAETTLRAFPQGAHSVIGQASYPPTDDAWLFHRRTDIAELCRYTLELQYARAGDRTEIASKITDYVNHLAVDLLLELGDERRAKPTQPSDND